MPRGGFRPGAGRPKKGGAKKKDQPSVEKALPSPADKPGPTSKSLEGELLPARLSPLDYALAVINDPEVPADRRDRMAIAAMPFLHGKVAEQGKKEAKQEAASKASGGRFGRATPPPTPGVNRSH